jgi:uncharacterized protein (DUF488 family)
MGLKPSSAERAIWTVGHSNHSLETFFDLLGQHQITLLVDIRSSPYSRYASQFNKEAIRSPLQARDIEYLFLGDLLGGRAEGGQFYDPEGHVLYDRLARSPKFQQGVERLLEQVGTSRAALMCGEEDPTDCHRRLLIGRVLAVGGLKVMHIRGDGQIQSEEEVAEEERFRKTKGQLTLFDMEEPDEWKSIRSVLPKKAPPSSSESSSEPESGG